MNNNEIFTEFYVQKYLQCHFVLTSAAVAKIMRATAQK